MKAINEMIAHLDPCAEAVEWLGKRTNIKKAWNECSKANWMLWLAAHFIDRKTVILSACDCTETVLEYIPKNDSRPREAVDTTRLWAEDKINFVKVRQAASFTATAFTDAAISITDNIIYTAYAAVATTVDFAASVALNTSVTVSNVVVYVAATTANAVSGPEIKLQKSKNLKKLASLVRKRITAEMVEESLLKSVQR